MPLELPNALDEYYWMITIAWRREQKNHTRTLSGILVRYEGDTHQDLVERALTDVLNETQANRYTVTMLHLAPNVLPQPDPA